MKTKQYTIAMLIALMVGTISIQAQSTRRANTQENKKRTAATRTYPKKETTQKERTTQPSRQVKRIQTPQQPQVQRKRSAQPTRQVQRATQPQDQRQRSVSHTKRPVSVSNTHNPRSTYSRGNNTVNTGNRTVHRNSTKYRSERYYGGHHYHNAYPTRKVKFHYHHDTYVNNYRVLYYPAYSNIYWTRNMYRDYHRWYPEYRWTYDYGHRIQTISAFDAQFYMGEVAMVYGRVYATWHNKETDDYLLFFGGDYPRQQFTVVLPGHIAHRFSWRPERYFLGEHMTITGLITTYDGIPEIVVKNKRQVGIY